VILFRLWLQSGQSGQIGKVIKLKQSGSAGIKELFRKDIGGRNSNLGRNSNYDSSPGSGEKSRIAQETPNLGRNHEFRNAIQGLIKASHNLIYVRFGNIPIIMDSD
jgi:hypothetical protein